MKRLVSKSEQLQRSFKTRTAEGQFIADFKGNTDCDNKIAENINSISDDVRYQKVLMAPV